VGSPEYADYVEKVARRLAANGPLTLQALEATIGDSREAIVRAITELRRRDAESQPAGRRLHKPVDGLFALVERAS
jgi:biotin operon repressor